MAGCDECGCTLYLRSANHKLVCLACAVAKLIRMPDAKRELARDRLGEAVLQVKSDGQARYLPLALALRNRRCLAIFDSEGELICQIEWKPDRDRGAAGEGHIAGITSMDG